MSSESSLCWHLFSSQRNNRSTKIQIKKIITDTSKCNVIHLSHQLLSGQLFTSYVPCDLTKHILFVSKWILARLGTYDKCNEKTWKEQMSYFTSLSIALDTKLAGISITYSVFARLGDVGRMMHCPMSAFLSSQFMMMIQKKNEWFTVLWRFQNIIFVFIFPFLHTALKKKIRLQRVTFIVFLFYVYLTHIYALLFLSCVSFTDQHVVPAFLLMTWFPGGIPPNFLIRISEWGKKRQIIQPDIKDRSPIHILHQNLLMDLLDFFAVNKEVSSAETSHKKCHKL